MEGAHSHMRVFELQESLTKDASQYAAKVKNKHVLHSFVCNRGFQQWLANIRSASPPCSLDKWRETWAQNSDVP